MAQIVGGVSKDGYCIGGVIMTNLNKLIVLSGYVAGGSNNFTTLRNVNTAAGYAVPASKKLVMKAALITASVVGAGNTGGFGYGDNDVGLNTTSEPTNSEYVFRSTSDHANGVLSTVGNIEFALPPFEVPTTKYPFFNISIAAGTPTTVPTVYYYLENA